MRLKRREFLSTLLASGLVSSLNACGGGGDAPAPTPVSNIDLKLLAGNSKPTLTSTDGSGAGASFFDLMSVAVDSAQIIYATDSGAVRRITPDGTVTTLAGAVLQNGYVDGTGTAARLDIFSIVAADPIGELLVLAQSQGLIRGVTPSGVVTTLVGGTDAFVNGQFGTVYGTLATLDTNPPTETAFRSDPMAVAADRNGSVFVANATQVLKITPAGAVTVLAGTATSGHVDGTGSAARFNAIVAMTIDSTSNLYVSEYTPNLSLPGTAGIQGTAIIRKVTPAGVITTVAGGVGGVPNIIGYADGPSASAQFTNILGLAADSVGNVYAADCFNSAVRKIGTDGTVSTVVGSPKSTTIVTGPTSWPTGWPEFDCDFW